MGEFLVALSDFDSKRAWLELGYTSLFYFLHQELGLSKGAAFYRKTAAELIQSFPEVVEPLRDGRLCLTTVVELSKVLTPENRDEVLPRFFHLSKSEAKEVAVEIRPSEAPLRDVVAAVPSVAPALMLEPTRPTDLGQSVHLANQAPTPVAPPALPVPPRRASVEPLNVDESRVHLTVSRRFVKKLEAARDALSHSHPGAGLDEILEAGLDLLLDRDAKRKGLVKKPRAVPPPSSDPDHVPAHVRRAVWERDGGRCQFKLASGEICGSTYQLEIDHHPVPRALGGPSTVENCRIACRVHNGAEARKAFGDAAIDRIIRSKRVRSAREDTAPTPSP